MPASVIDVGALIERSPWTTYQKALTLLAAIAVIFDGFDIQILGFAIPSIMAEWHLKRAAFAPVLAIGLAGMALGSPFAGYCGDRFGRRTTMIGCVALFGAATIATAFARGIPELAILRFLTGMGAGGALPNASALVAEFAPVVRRPMAVTLTIVCVPLGGMIGGVGAARILPAYGWHTLYVIGGMAPLLLGLALWVALPESPRYLVRHPARWNELARLLRRFGHALESGCGFTDPRETVKEGHSAIGALFSRGLRLDTVGLWIAFFASLNAVYLVFGWLPAMLTAQGLDLGAASSGLAAYNFGGVLGVLIWAVMVTYTGSRAPLLGGCVAGAASALALQLILTRAPGTHTLLLAGIGLHGLFANAVQTTMYALAAHVYPTKIRASGVALAAAIGRLGAMLSSFTGASLIQLGSMAFLGVLAVSLLCAGIGLAIVRAHFARPEARG
ncbi:MAG TPA: MFS transporter [Bryobacteraceae bacterium]|nr:MFS transporter [Bryobacteraceae bacterium]